MKKAQCLLLATLFILTLFSGCSFEASKSSEEELDIEVEAADEEIDVETEASDDEQDIEVETSEEEDVETELAKGEIRGNVYKNSYLGFKFIKPESWVYATDEEIAAVMNMTVEQVLGNEYEEMLENNIAIFDMMVTDSITRTNINISYENLKKTFSSNITEEQYIDVVKQQLTGVPGMTVSFSEELEKVYLGKSEFTRCVCESTAADNTFTQILYLRKIDGYMVSVIATVIDGYTVEDIEGMFK